MNKKTGQRELCVSCGIYLPGGIKLSSESQPELARQHVVKQKPVGRRAWRRRAAFYVPVGVT